MKAGSSPTREQGVAMRRWVETWQRAAPLLQEQRDEDIRRANTALGFAMFAGAPLANLETFPPGDSSGLVEQQKWFQILRRSMN